MSRRNHAQRKRFQKRVRQSRKSPPVTNKEDLAALQESLQLNDNIFAKVKFHGNTTWSPGSLVWLALGWSWSECRNVTDAFAEAAEWSEKICGSKPLSTYQGFMGALTRWTPVFIPLLCAILQQRMEEWGGKFWQIDGWVPIAFDGSRSTAPRTKDNEQAFCAANYGKGQTARYRKKKSQGMRRKKNERNKPQPQEPQAWITLLWHMGLRLPWSWRLGPSNSSERAHVSEMIENGKFPKNTLFCGDAGFVGYPLWSQILRRKAHFLVRVGANVSLLTEGVDYQRRQGGLVLCWPKTSRQANQPPLRLRLVRVRLGKTKAWMLTSVLDPSRLTIRQIVKFYKLRWGIEVEFRGLKQTLDCAKLCCRNDQRLLAELDWSILAMAIAELLALKEQLSQKRPQTARDQPSPNPAKRSLAQTMRALRHCLRNLDDVPSPNESLVAKLRRAVTDSYQRKALKRARYRPPNPDKKPLGDPQLRRLTPQEQKELSFAEKTAA
jgi:hypothetical protein